MVSVSPNPEASGKGMPKNMSEKCPSGEGEPISYENEAASRRSSTSDELDEVVHTPPETPQTPSSPSVSRGTLSPAQGPSGILSNSPLERQAGLEEAHQSLDQIEENLHGSKVGTSSDSDDSFDIVPPQTSDRNIAQASETQTMRTRIPPGGFTTPSLPSDSSYEELAVEEQRSADNVASLPRRANDPPSAEDWENHRNIFLKHYIYECRTLKNARAIMASRYGFKATERMYKKRIADWGLRKYSARHRRRNTSSDSNKSNSSPHRPHNRQDSPPHNSLDASRQMVRSGSQSSLAKHQRSLRQDLDSYLRSTDGKLTYDRFMALSKDLSNVEVILTQVHNYYESYDEAKWNRVFPKTARASIKELPLCSDMQMVSRTAATQPVRHPGELFNRVHMAIELLKMKTPEADQLAWKMLGDAFGMIKDVLEQQHPQLLRYFFMQFWDHTLDEHPDIRRTLFRCTYEMAAHYLGPTHPITIIAQLLPDMDHTSHVCEVSWRRQLHTFEVILGEGSDESLRLKMALTGNYVVAGQYDQADSILRQIVALFDPNSTAYYHRAARCRIAWIQSLRHDYDPAEEGFVNVLRLCQAQPGVVSGPAVVDDIYLASITHLARIRSRRDYSQGEILLADALELCGNYFGAEHAYTYTIANELKILKEMAISNAMLDELVLMATPK